MAHGLALSASSVSLAKRLVNASIRYCRSTTCQRDEQLGASGCVLPLPPFSWHPEVGHIFPPARCDTPRLQYSRVLSAIGETASKTHRERGVRPGLVSCCCKPTAGLGWSLDDDCRRPRPPRVCHRRYVPCCMGHAVIEAGDYPAIKPGCASCGSDVPRQQASSGRKV